ncbi:DUF3795 domain-containing protein [Candidatus Formimonas warabiya]|uniref:DUF3795 domain-containing protein n=1 Tax=Formimonas warabiya TaxID=1761012 RepID=A0A3G1KRK0_FORW1|nr:DUF3795 domain-containing protein [Candidatus Formimonas warabiya]ATW25089.1 hypothetical protein DCMF_10150 [Candidatus Formimonas warabiya]
MALCEIVNKIAACGLDCSRCADYENGEIKKLSRRLQGLLKGYERLALIKAKTNPAFEGFKDFQELLNIFAGASCGGCSSQNVKCPIDCHAKTCHKEKKVDFCFQCDEYPCERQFEGKMRERWMERNNRMREIGVERYYEEQSKMPRY